jgi:hypothetical protein
VLLHFFVCHSIDKCMGSLPMDEIHGNLNKGMVRQLLDGCCKLLR